MTFANRWVIFDAILSLKVINIPIMYGSNRLGECCALEKLQ